MESEACTIDAEEYNRYTASAISKDFKLRQENYNNFR
jgi:hypothetical protein